MHLSLPVMDTAQAQHSTLTTRDDRAAWEVEFQATYIQPTLQVSSAFCCTRSENIFLDTVHVTRQINFKYCINAC